MKIPLKIYYLKVIKKYIHVYHLNTVYLNRCENMCCIHLILESFFITKQQHSPISFVNYDLENILEDLNTLSDRG